MTATMDRTTQGTGVAGRLSDILSPLVGGELPVRLTAWDGSTAGPEDAPKVTLYSPNVLRRLLWNPGELGAAQAYVLGELDVEGDLGDALTHVWKVSAERGLGSITPTPSLVLAAVKAARSFGAFGETFGSAGVAGSGEGAPAQPRPATARRSGTTTICRTISTN